ncbi:TA system antitoxin ParD family protein [Neptuniibacter marinus]|uniref:TA system antitoxin ParD family protein n=1 Tax=Neptuniibacter marinus TaxID=1806670 RepID=UPI003B5C9B07
MAKAHSPLRLDANLVEQAKLSGKHLHRSTAEQIEYWADIGRSVSKVITPETLLQLYAGLVKVKVEPVDGPTVDPDRLFDILEDDRVAGCLQDNITSSSLKYQASAQYPGMLEQIALDDTVIVGQFENGKFTPSAGVICE